MNFGVTVAVAIADAPIRLAQDEASVMHGPAAG
jgi:hypothetical protein